MPGGKALLALERTGFNRLCVGGGVAANRPFRERLEQLAAERGFELHVPPLALCTDNAVMGAIAVERLKAGQFAGLDLDIEAGLDRVTRHVGDAAGSEFRGFRSYPRVPACRRRGKRRKKRGPSRSPGRVWVNSLTSRLPLTGPSPPVGTRGSTTPLLVGR